MVADRVVYCYTKNLRRQAKAIFVCNPKERGDLKMIRNENDVLTNDELVVARNFLRKSKHACLYIQNEFSCRFKLLNHILFLSESFLTHLIFVYRYPHLL